MNTYLAKDIHKMIPNDNLTTGTVTPAVINGGNANTTLGLPPNTTIEDWVVLLKSTTTTSLEEEMIDSKTIYAFLNPSTDGIFNLSQTANWKVTTILGKESKTGNGNQVDLTENPKGVYLITMNNKVERVVIE